MIFLTNFNPAIQILIIISINTIVSILFLSVFSLCFPKIKKKNINLIYAFSSGFILSLSFLGLIQSGVHHLQDHYKDKYLLQIIIILSGGIIGSLIYLIVRKIIIKNSKNIHIDHLSHGHSDEIIHINDADHPRFKSTAIFLLLLHKIPAGITLGLLIFGLNENHEQKKLGVLIAFILHIIPEQITIYYRQIEMGNSKIKSFIYSILSEFILLPFMFIAYYLANFINTSYWFMPLILISGGMIMAIASISELIPGLIHNRLMAKEWYKTFALISIGILLSTCLMIFHVH